MKGTCHWCGREREITRDHVISKAVGGGDGDDNIVQACWRCQNARSLLLQLTHGRVRAWKHAAVMDAEAHMQRIAGTDDSDPILNGSRKRLRKWFHLYHENRAKLAAIFPKKDYR